MSRVKGSLNKKTLDEAVAKQTNSEGVPRIILFLEEQGLAISKENFKGAIEPYISNISSRKGLIDLAREYGFIPVEGTTYTMCGAKEVSKFFVKLVGDFYENNPSRKSKVATGPIVAVVKEEEVVKKRGRPKKETTTSLIASAAEQKTLKVVKKRPYDTSPKSEKILDQKLIELLLEEITKINTKLDNLEVILQSTDKNEVPAPKDSVTVESLRKKYTLSFPTRSDSEEARAILTSSVSTKEALFHVISDVSGKSLEDVTEDFKLYNMDQVKSIVIPTITEI